MMFADGEEPVGVRVLTYQSSRSINTILNALNEDEIRYLRESSFGKLVEMAEKPAFLVDLLDIYYRDNLRWKKKHEAWFRFAGKPLPSSLDFLAMKMLKEHAELLGDIEECLSYPWGRLAFDMLMTSLKNRDEISLSQNTIPLKEFALALQLVIVEAVPALTEVVQDACSSSESESEDDETEYPVSKAKKKTLNHAHAREVDRKAEDMFKGGATKSDVEKMWEESKNVGKKKQIRLKETQSRGADEDKLASVVLALLKPEIKRIDDNVSAGIASMKELVSSSLQYKDDVIATRLNRQYVEDMFYSTTYGIRFFQTSYGLGEDENANTIGNVLKNLSHYSTPPGSPNLVPVSGALCHKENSSLPRGGRLGEDNHQLTPLAREDIEETDAVSHHDKSTLPSGSPLLRTNNQVTSGSHQSCPDKDAPAPHEDDQMGENESELSVETQHDTIISRKRQTYADSPTIFTNRLPVVVNSIIPQDPQRPVNESVLVWTDELFDIKVENLMKLIYQDFVFAKDMFKGGATKSNVEKIWEESKNVVVLALLKPEIKRIDGNVSAGIASMKELVSSSLQYKDDVIATRLNRQYVEDMFYSTTYGIRFFQTSYGLGVDENANTIGNVLKNLSHYSTPPGSPNLVPVSGALCHKENSSLPRGGQLDEDNHQLTPLAREDIEETDAVSHHDKSTFLRVHLFFVPTTKSLQDPTSLVPSYKLHFEQPSFSLGLTQDKDAPAPREDDQMGENESELSVETQHDTIISRIRQTYADNPTIFTNRLPVVDILMRIVRSTFDNQVMGKVDASAAFMESRFASLLCRNHPKFKIQKNKSAFLFSKKIVDAVMNSCQSFTPATRFYLPFCIGKQHWIGLCLDFSASKLYVFDCNAGLNADSTLQRIQGVAQNQNPGDAAITTSLLIQTHSLFGTDPCLGITPSVIADEAHRAVVMVYEFHAKL
ncbi:hypothetical protein IGI04_026521 [Brassica rapa subsp. trilocularis]|uniref:Ubiquitin-like protease family profile domain-containing protein n=1 Tax=Brassica rapa subsp. trilocularis TaxID=1813537 RepID=A0ABQ7KWJ3_BRACM|nr:hypothetical protein IGI04_026521 [Brassica rapa subsp. trilocularis]